MVIILRCFAAVSGLKVNLSKSTLLGISGDDSSLDLFAAIMGCKLDTFPSSYFGLPLYLNREPEFVWSPILEKMEKNLSPWKAKYFSLGGRITLIQSSLANLPIYFKSILKCLISITKRIEKLQRDFVWQAQDVSKKFHLVYWNTVCSRKDSGRLGLRPLMHHEPSSFGQMTLENWRRHKKPMEKYFYNQIQYHKEWLGYFLPFKGVL